MSTTPSNAEAWDLWLESITGGHPPASLAKFARAVLAKWGTPQPVVRGALTANQVSEFANSAGYWHGDTSRADFINGIRYAEAAHDIKGGQHD